MAQNNLNIPQAQFLDPITQLPSLPWLLWLQNPNVTSLNVKNGVATSSGGTGTNQTPANGQVLIGNGSGYTLGNITAGTGTTVTNGSGTITINNTGLLAFSTGTTGLSQVTSNGTVTIGGTLSVGNGGTGATTASDAQANLGLGTLATQNASAVSIGTLTTSGALTFNGQATTGTHTTIAKWLPVKCDNTTYYIPLYT